VPLEIERSLQVVLGDCHLDTVEGGHDREVDVRVLPRKVSGPGLAKWELMAYADEVADRKTLFSTN
jgi:hypothetical protein